MSYLQYRIVHISTGAITGGGWVEGPVDNWGLFCDQMEAWQASVHDLRAADYRVELLSTSDVSPVGVIT